MKRRWSTRTGFVLASAVVFCVVGRTALQHAAAAEQAKPQMPIYQVDATWMKPLPNHWILGSVIGVAVDDRDHMWIIHRPSTLQRNELRGGWTAAPPILEFDPQGRLVSSFGGPGPGYEWPQSEHGIYVDYKGNVWTGGGGSKDAAILKFSRSGKFLLQIGHKGKNGGSNDTENLGGAANMVVDPATNEIYVADGYVNHRVIVFDADTGQYKRHWGAYGKRPDDSYFARPGGRGQAAARGGVENEDNGGGARDYKPGAPQPQFRIVHAVQLSKDGYVYVCDRVNDRIQVFKKDGTFVKEAFIGKETIGGSGSTWDIAFSNDPAQTFIINPDGTNEIVWQLLRQSLDVVGWFGSGGHNAGQFYGAHSIAADSKGNVYITETYEGKRVQKFVYRGLGPANGAPTLK
jgi:DNA-binding beta-propeller fold protein YncE